VNILTANTDEDEIREAFGDNILSLVLEGTDDKSHEKMERKRLQISNASKKSPDAKQIKIADKTCNLRSVFGRRARRLAHLTATRSFQVGLSSCRRNERYKFATGRRSGSSTRCWYVAANQGGMNRMNASRINTDLAYCNLCPSVLICGSILVRFAGSA